MNDASDPDFAPLNLEEVRIAIIGLGLMGGSLALALRGQCKALLAADPDDATVALAQQFRVVHNISTDLGEVLPDADVVILAAPVESIIEIIPELPNYCSDNPIVLDLGSTKVEIVRALESLPSRFETLGGHPMCGKETSGLSSADPDLYRGAPFAFTPLSATTRRASSLAEQIARAVGAHPLWLDPETHDRWVAATSHLPYLISSALALGTPENVSPLIGPGFLSASRLASSHPGVMLDILRTNREYVLEALNRFQVALDHLKSLLTQGEYPDMYAALSQSKAHRETMIGGRASP